MPYRRALRVLGLAALSFITAAPVRAQFRAGPEFRANTFTTGDQLIPSVAVEPRGGFVVVWQSYLQDGDQYGIFGQVYREDGAPSGAQFRVNAYTTGTQATPFVCLDGSQFVVAWSSYGQDGDYGGVFARRFRSDGTPIGGDFQVNTSTTGYQGVTALVKDRRNGSAAGFIVVWTDYEQDGGTVMARRFDERGVPRGGEFRVNVYTPYLQTGGRVGAAPDGRFVVVWASYGQDGDSQGVFARRFDAAGNPAGGEFRVNTVTTGGQYPGGVAV